ncbi:MAG: glycoside hydrolase family 55 protein, partial [Candidatus Sumerlaeia bacterium]|nr:glycoside hydrolase family 55 protein [Candidatus Sumerlaeia bacterium]
MRRKKLFYWGVILACLMLAGVFSHFSLADSINVKDFGAIGDGKTDDTKAFQTALDTASGKDEIGGTVFVPQGTYLIAGHLNIPS